jgi:predicted GNAT family acetyltransferase
MAQIDVTDNPDEHRYEVWVDGTLAGRAFYRLRRNSIVFTHTEVDDAYSGQGIGGALARGALDDVRARGEHTVVAQCPFISAWLARHPDYQDLIAS